MAGDGLDVVVDSLVGAAGGINTLVANLACGRIDAINTTADLGHESLNTALATFGERWTYGVAALCTDQCMLAERLREFVEDITGVDLLVADTYRAAADGLETSL